MGTDVPNNGGARDRWVVFDGGQGPETGKVHRLTRHVAVFEIFEGGTLLQMSQVLGEFKVIVNERDVYTGRAVVRSIVHTGLSTLCEALLEDDWVVTPVQRSALNRDEPVAGFRAFLNDWQKVYRILPEFKVVVADLHTFLSDLRLWMEQWESHFREEDPQRQAERRIATMRALEDSVVETFNTLHERFELVSNQVDPELRPAHQHFVCRHLHPLFLSSPFGYRAYSKPLGYAGDYEMVNMIMRPPYEGNSLFAQAMNVWLLRQYPSEAHRNRISYLEDRLTEETLRVKQAGRSARILNLGCGPAREIRQFLETSLAADYAEFMLVDMSEETLEYTRKELFRAKEQSDRRTTLHFRRRSAMGLLKDASRTSQPALEDRFDFIYCAGLFDYLTDTLCQKLVEMFCRWLAPGGLVLVTNVATVKPFQHMLEFLLDWHLIYRTSRQLSAFAPPDGDPLTKVVRSDATGVNLFLEVRKERIP